MTRPIDFFWFIPTSGDGSYLGSAVPARDIPRFVELWRAGRLPVEELVSSTIPLDDINTGMDELAAGRAVRQIIQFN